MSLQSVTEHYDITIGIECHVQLKTVTKLFSGADNDARDKAPNTTVSPICFGFPGVLPVLNEQALTLAIRAGLALNATIPELSRFERKHYFYPDLPKGYQITQLAEPVIIGGYVDISPEGISKRIRIHHAHLEEDAGKLTHPSGGKESFVDLNRAGTPLIEIVSEADIHSPAEARAYAEELYLLMTYADVTFGDLYHGNMRFDVNLSLAPHGSKTLGTRTEVKNLNSFRAVEKAAEYEAVRQASLLKKGEAVIQETRGWNEDKQQTFSQRSKEDAHDYRYFPDADIPPVRISETRVNDARVALPKLPSHYRHVWQPLAFDSSVINSMLRSRRTAHLITEILAQSGDNHAKRIAHWFVSAVDSAQPTQPNQLGDMSDVNSKEFVHLSQMVEDKELSSTSAKIIFNMLLVNDGDARGIAESMNLLQVSNESELEAIVATVLADPKSEKAVADIREGNEKAIGYLVGQVMKLSHGKANPSIATKLIKEKLAP